MLFMREAVLEEEICELSFFFFFNYAKIYITLVVVV